MALRSARGASPAREDRRTASPLSARRVSSPRPLYSARTASSSQDRRPLTARRGSSSPRSARPQSARGRPSSPFAASHSYSSSSLHGNRATSCYSATPCGFNSFAPPSGYSGGSSSSSRSSEVLASIPSRPKQRGSKLKGSADEEDVGEELIPAVPRPRLTKGVGSNVRSSADEEEAMDEEPAAAVAASRSRPTKGGGFKPSKANKPKQKKGKKQKPK